MLGSPGEGAARPDLIEISSEEVISPFSSRLSSRSELGRFMAR